MLERRSALATVRPYRSPVLKIEEAPGYTLTQFAGGDAAKISKISGALPESVGQASERNGRTLFRIAPGQYWSIGPAADDLAARLEGLCAITPLTSSRTRMVLEGPPARDVLAKGVALDFHSTVFAAGQFALTGLHHMPLAIHCTGENVFHIYAMRTYAMSVWEWLTDAAREFGGP